MRRDLHLTRQRKTALSMDGCFFSTLATWKGKLCGRSDVTFWDQHRCSELQTAEDKKENRRDFKKTCSQSSKSSDLCLFPSGYWIFREWRKPYRLSWLVAPKDSEAKSCVFPPQEYILLLEVWNWKNEESTLKISALTQEINVSPVQRR